MDLPRKTLRLDAKLPADIARAAAILREGGIVAFPTETVYGLGANALDPAAVAKIFEAKQRPSWDPLIVHIADHEMLAWIAEPGRELPSFARNQVEDAMATHWPGPLTLLLPRAPAISDAVTAGRALVGVRMPAHPVALELIRLAGVPVAAPSANLFGHTSPTSAQHVLDDLDGRIDAVLDGGPCEVGLESTVAEMTTAGFVIYRPGAIDLDLWGATEVERSPGFSASDAPLESLPSPGLSLRHYAPRARLVLSNDLTHHREPLELSLVNLIDEVQTEGSVVGVMLPDHWQSSSAQFIFPWGPWGDHETLARRVFAGLRKLDEQGATVIVCPMPSDHGIGRAVRDRLRRAARTV